MQRTMALILATIAILFAAKCGVDSLIVDPPVKIYAASLDI